MTARPDVVFIHGMYMNGHSWQPWVREAAERGYAGHAPSWPYHDGEPTTLRHQIDPALGRLTFGAVTEHLKRYIDALDRRPIVIGHSIGGLVVQKLVNDGYAAAGVSISPAPPRGVFSADPHFFRANFPHINPFAGNRPVRMTKERFRYTFCNTMSPTDSDKAFDEYVVPESRNVPRSTLSRQASIDFRRPHVPLLVIAGDQDHLTPASMIKRNVQAYRAGAGIVDFKEFAGRSHFICNQDGWHEVSAYAFDWISARG